MKVLSVSNIKGGVAKTTTAATLAAGLHKRGYKVLMIDSDPQMNLTMCFLDEPEEGTPSLYTLYDKGTSIDDLKVSIKDGLDLVLGDFELCSADMEFFKRAGSLKLLAKAIKGIKENYDYIILDTPPNLGFLSLNAFMISDYIVTPMAADSFSLKAIRLLKKTLSEVSEEAEKDIPVAGILLTRYTDRTNVAKLLEDSVVTAAELLDTSVFNSRIRQATVVQESQIVKMDLFEYAPKAPVTKDYDEFIDELLKRIGE
ncbi:ParA family protein [Butyrivibrio sp. AE3004]|uniref:ParA family protein n=1 Tax=Butyrivibrio sp. AE3004 TaxID=1506994 RepID=UPI000493BC2E|nr:ParA family protein [Butyrivibrio sp. AE3004]